MERKQVAERPGRLTGSGIFSESQKLGGFESWQETGVIRSDTVQTAAYKRDWWNRRPGHKKKVDNLELSAD